MYGCYWMPTDSSLHSALTARRATTSASVSASLLEKKKSKELLPAGLEGLTLLQLITTTAIFRLTFILTSKRRIDLFGSRSCAEAPSRRSFCLVV